MLLCCSQDRKVTLKKVDEFLTKEIAPLELASDIKVFNYLFRTNFNLFGKLLILILIEEMIIVGFFEYDNC